MLSSPWHERTPNLLLDFEGCRKKLELNVRSIPIASVAPTERESQCYGAGYLCSHFLIAMMGLGSVDIAEKKALKQKGDPVYLYNFGYKSRKKIGYAMGTPHAMDISFKFNNNPTQRWFCSKGELRWRATDTNGLSLLITLPNWTLPGNWVHLPLQRP